jgi:energy-coupling factor transporter ATP-binding protein EcfA2
MMQSMGDVARLTLVNFRCFERASFAFDAANASAATPDPNRVTLVSGASGSGKSSLFAAMHFAVTGDGKKVTRFGCKSCSVEMRVGADMTILREKGPGRLRVRTNGRVYEDKEAQAVIDARLPNWTIGYVAQRAVVPFIAMTPAEKLTFVERLAFANDGDAGTRVVGDISINCDAVSDAPSVEEINARCRATLSRRKETLALATRERETMERARAMMDIDDDGAPLAAAVAGTDTRPKAAIGRQASAAKPIDAVGRKDPSDAVDSTSKPIEEEEEEEEVTDADVKRAEEEVTRARRRAQDARDCAERSAARSKRIADLHRELDDIAPMDKVETAAFLDRYASGMRVLLAENARWEEAKRARKNLDDAERVLGDITTRVPPHLRDGDWARTLTDFKDLIRTMNARDATDAVRKRVRELDDIIATTTSVERACPACGASIVVDATDLTVSVPDERAMDRLGCPTEGLRFARFARGDPEMFNRDRERRRTAAVAERTNAAQRLERVEADARDMEAIRARYSLDDVADVSAAYEALREATRQRDVVELYRARIDDDAAPPSVDVAAINRRVEKELAARRRRVDLTATIEREEAACARESGAEYANENGADAVSVADEEVRRATERRTTLERARATIRARRYRAALADITRQELEAANALPSIGKLQAIVRDAEKRALVQTIDELNARAQHYIDRFIPASSKDASSHDGSSDSDADEEEEATSPRLRSASPVRPAGQSTFESGVRGPYAAKRRRVVAQRRSAGRPQRQSRSGPQGPQRQSRSIVGAPTVALTFDGRLNVAVTTATGHDGDLASLSGGEFARVALAFTIALAELYGVDTLLLDETFASLDLETSDVVLRAIRHSYAGRVICIAHQTTKGVFDRVIELPLVVDATTTTPSSSSSA